MEEWSWGCRSTTLISASQWFTKTVYLSPNSIKGSHQRGKENQRENSRTLSKYPSSLTVIFTHNYLPHFPPAPKEGEWLSLPQLRPFSQINSFRHPGMQKYLSMEMSPLQAESLLLLTYTELLKSIIFYCFCNHSPLQVPLPQTLQLLKTFSFLVSSFLAHSHPLLLNFCCLLSSAPPRVHSLVLFFIHPTHLIYV